MGAERRKQERTKCLIPCEVQIYGKLVEGTLRDISAGGLSLQVNLPVTQGDVLSLVLNLDRQRKIELQGIVWHDRRRKKTSGSIVQRIGLVLSEAPEAYRELLPAPKAKPPKPQPEPSVAKEQALPAQDSMSSGSTVLPEQTDSKASSRFRVRVKQDSNPRSRSIIVFAKDEDEARECAHAETGAGWHILELDRA